MIPVTSAHARARSQASACLRHLCVSGNILTCFCTFGGVAFSTVGNAVAASRRAPITARITTPHAARRGHILSGRELTSRHRASIIRGRDGSRERGSNCTDNTVRCSHRFHTGTGPGISQYLVLSTGSWSARCCGVRDQDGEASRGRTPHGVRPARRMAPDRHANAAKHSSRAAA